MNNLFVCIMAGGSGERFWPLSRRARPKHLLKLFSSCTLLEETIYRLEGVVSSQNIFVLTNEIQAGLSREILSLTLPPHQIVVEPTKRDTAPAAALATAMAYRTNPDSVVALLPADALIKHVETFREQFKQGLELASKSSAIVTFAIEPSYPATGFGYLELSPQEHEGVHRVTRFVEKPDLPRAEEYLKAGNYGWNSGIFIWKVQTFLSQARRLMPELAEFIEQFPTTGDYQDYLLEKFPHLPKISIDYAIMEKAEEVVAIKAKFDWDDVGTWTALPQHLGCDADGNTTRGSVYAYESKNNISFSSGRTIALCGVDNLVVVETKDSILVCHRDRVQEVKNILPKLPQDIT